MNTTIVKHARTKGAGKLAVQLLLLGIAAPAFAQDDEGERNMEATHCVRIASIDDIRILNDRTLLFEMRAGESYRNDLPRNCPGLDENDTLMYRSTVGQLCNIDIITVLDDWGFGFAPGVSCGLGMFHPVDEQTAQEPVAGE